MTEPTTTADAILSVDLDHFTVEEIEEIEDRTGQSIDTFGTPGAPKAKMLRAVVYVLRRRTDPDFTWEEAGKLKVHLEDVPVPPTDAAG